MKKNLTFSSLVMVLLFSACQKEIKETSEVAEKDVQAMSTARATAGGDVYLTVTVEDADANMIRSDAKGPYVHGRDKVQAVIWAAGDFFLNTNTTANREPMRKLAFDPSLAYPGFNAVKNHSCRTGSLNLQTMAVSEEPQLASFRVWGEEPAGTFTWKLLFRQGTAADDLLTNNVYVKRTSKDRWEIWTAENESNAKLVDANGESYYQVPFKLILNRK